eukprot:141067-Rhodomonas_salina.1
MDKTFSSGLRWGAQASASGDDQERSTFPIVALVTLPSNPSEHPDTVSEGKSEEDKQSGEREHGRGEERARVSRAGNHSTQNQLSAVQPFLCVNRIAMRPAAQCTILMRCTVLPATSAHCVCRSPDEGTGRGWRFRSSRGGSVFSFVPQDRQIHRQSNVVWKIELTEPRR